MPSAFDKWIADLQDFKDKKLAWQVIDWSRTKEDLKRRNTKARADQGYSSFFGSSP